MRIGLFTDTYYPRLNGVVRDISVIPTGIPLDKFSGGQTDIEKIIRLRSELVVARENRCLDGVVLEGKNGFAYRTTRERVQEIEYLRANKNVRAEFSLCSLSTAQTFSAKTYARRVQDVYVKLIDGQLDHVLHEVS